MIYCIGNTGKDICKIGVSTNPEKRLKQLQTGCPYPLQLLGCWEGSVTEEQELHKKFQEYRLGGEWFSLTPELQTFFGISHGFEVGDSVEGLMKEDGLVLKVYLWILALASKTTDRVLLIDKTTKEKASQLMHVAIGSINNVLSILVKKHYLTRLSNGKYKVNYLR